MAGTYNDGVAYGRVTESDCFCPRQEVASHDKQLNQQGDLIFRSQTNSKLLKQHTPGIRISSHYVDAVVVGLSF